MGRRSGFVDGRGTRLAAVRTPLAGAGAPAASGSRSWCRRRGCRARRWRPSPGWWPGRRRAAPRIAPAAPRSAGPSPGRARSPPNQGIEHKFESGSGTLRSPTGPLRAWVGRAGAATRRNLGDSKGQQGTTKAEVSGRQQGMAWAAKLLTGFHTAEPTGFCRSYAIIKMTLDLGRSLPVIVVAGSSPTGVGEESVSDRSHSASDRPARMDVRCS
jgi:hypothetical protein